MRIAHARAVAWLSTFWILALLWVWPRAVRAGTLSADVNGYDWPSLGWACGLGLLGGFLALIVALASDRRIVVEVLADGSRNALVSPIAGAAAYLLVDAAAGMGWLMLPSGGRFVVIVGGGWAGIAFFTWTRETAAKVAAGLAGWLADRAGGNKP